jgi:hypothetical protein
MLPSFSPVHVLHNSYENDNMADTTAITNGPGIPPVPSTSGTSKRVTAADRCTQPAYSSRRERVLAIANRGRAPAPIGVQRSHDEGAAQPASPPAADDALPATQLVATIVRREREHHCAGSGDAVTLPLGLLEGLLQESRQCQLGAERGHNNATPRLAGAHEPSQTEYKARPPRSPSLASDSRPQLQSAVIHFSLVRTRLGASGRVCCQQVSARLAGAYWHATLGPRDEFSVKWRFKNVGTCPWERGTYLGLAPNSSFNAVPGPAVLQTAVPPGAAVDVELRCVCAPGVAGAYWAAWQWQHPMEDGRAEKPTSHTNADNGCRLALTVAPPEETASSANTVQSLWCSPLLCGSVGKLSAPPVDIDSSYWCQEPETLPTPSHSHSTHYGSTSSYPGPITLARSTSAPSQRTTEMVNSRPSTPIDATAGGLGLGVGRARAVSCGGRWVTDAELRRAEAGHYTVDAGAVVAALAAVARRTAGPGAPLDARALAKYRHRGKYTKTSPLHRGHQRLIAKLSPALRLASLSPPCAPSSSTGSALHSQSMLPSGFKLNTDGEGVARGRPCASKA